MSNIIRCPHCSRDVDVTGHAGNVVPCPICHGVIQVAAASPAPPPIEKKPPTDHSSHFVLENADEATSDSNVTSPLRRRQRTAGISGLCIVGIVVMMLGAVYSIGVFFFSDISVFTTDGYVVNLVKMAQKIVNLIAGATMFLTGTVFLSAGCVINAVRSK
jgi:hypothetical protein